MLPTRVPTASGSDDLPGAWRGRQQREVDVESDLEGVGDGCELTDGGVSATGLQRRDYRLGDLHALGELQLCEPDLLAGGADAPSHNLGVYG